MKGAVAIEVVAALYYIWKNPAQLPDFFHFPPPCEQILIIGDSEQSRSVDKAPFTCLHFDMSNFMRFSDQSETGLSVLPVS